MNKISSFFQRTREEGERPRTTGRLHVDYRLGSTLVGWACTAQGEPAGEILLQTGSHTAAMAVHPCHRSDVSEALGLPATRALGFSLNLPLHLWGPTGELLTQNLELLAEGQRLPLQVPATAEVLLTEFILQQAHPEWVSACRSLLQQLAQQPQPTWLVGEALAQCQRHARRIGWPQWPSAETPAPQGHLEHCDGLTWRGWVYGQDPAAEALRLYVNGQELAAQVIRTDRADVAASVQSSRRHLGFELELPGSIWQHAQPDGCITLELWAGALNLCPQGVEWTSHHLRQHLCQLFEEVSSTPDTPSSPEGTRQYDVLLGLEHWLAVDTPLDLPAAAQQWLLAQAQRFGLSAKRSTSALPQRAPLAGPQHDLATIELWSMLRRFNAAVSEDGSNAPAVLSEMLGAREWGDDPQHRLVFALIPYFCGIGRYEALRPWIPVGQLRTMAADTSAWGLSLILPELVWTEHYALARRAMARLASLQNGWLNTECVAAVVRRLREHWPQAPRDQAQAKGLVEATLELLEAQASSYWGRSHDHHLTQAAVEVVVLSRQLPAQASQAVLSATLRQQAFHPGFWQALKQHWPEQARWPADLQWALSRFEDFEAAVWRGDFSAPATVPLLMGSATQGCLDAAVALRACALHAVSADTEAPQALAAWPSLLSALSPKEALRLAAHPQARPEWLRQPAALAQLIQGHDSPRTTVLREWQAAQLQALWAGAPADSRGHTPECDLLATKEHAGVGVVMSVLTRMPPTASGSGHATAAGLSDIRALWTRLFDDTADHAVPPAALLQAWSLLIRWQALDPSSDKLPRLISEFERLACSRWGHALSAMVQGPAPEHRVLSSPDLLRTAVVAIYSCRKNLAGRVEHIKASWGQRLQALGIPWIVVVGDGTGSEARLEDHLLELPVPDSYEALPLKTLALVRWVHDHTDFTHLIKIDDDCHLAVDRFFSQSPHLAHHYVGRKLSRGIGGTQRTWHQSKSASTLARQAIDKSPEPSEYADGGSGYGLSRFAMSTLIKGLESTAGARLTRSAYMEDKLVGDLLALGGITVCEEGFNTLVRRRFGSDPSCVNAYSNTFYPSLASPTLVTHLDDATAHAVVERDRAASMLRPAKIWPSYEAPRLTDGGSNQLELLSPPAAVNALQEARVIVVAVLRNELLLLPHFLAHYRKLGASHFVLVDNLSDDGSRAYLLSQPDVLLYSADTEYRQSHYGVAWQQAVLAAHALGKWVVLADIDEFLVYDNCESRSLPQWVAELDQERINAVTTLMVDMYPKGPLADADFQQQNPFECAPCFDRRPLMEWKLGSGCFSNGKTWLSGLRHRLIADSAPNFYTSQKLAILKYQPWIRLSEGLHYASNVTTSQQVAYFAHFKYHAGFQNKVIEEVARKQHFNNAEEYQRYMSMVAEGSGTLWSAESLTFTHSSDYRRATALINIHPSPEKNSPGALQ